MARRYPRATKLLSTHPCLLASLPNPPPMDNGLSSPSLLLWSMPSSKMLAEKKVCSKCKAPAVSIGSVPVDVKRADTFPEGEFVDLIDEFSDGRVQFAFAKVKDPNTTLPKSVLIGWCGEGVPERTKGYFTSHLATVSKVLHVSAFLDIVSAAVAPS